MQPAIVIGSERSGVIRRGQRRAERRPVERERPCPRPLPPGRPGCSSRVDHLARAPSTASCNGARQCLRCLSSKGETRASGSSCAKPCVSVGRDKSNTIQLHDTEISRHHAELRGDRRPVSSWSIWTAPTAPSSTVSWCSSQTLKSGDRVQLGRTLMIFTAGEEHSSARAGGRDRYRRRGDLGSPVRGSSVRSASSRGARSSASSRIPRAPGWPAPAATST